MPGRASFVWRGDREMKAKLLLAGRNLNRDYRIANRNEADAIVLLVNNELVPVKSGGLRDSAKVVGSGSNGVQSVMTITYSGPHALAHHEIPQFNPPSWGTRTTLNWVKPGTGAKFLEKGMRRRANGMGARIGRQVMF